MPDSAVGHPGSDREVAKRTGAELQQAIANMRGEFTARTQAVEAAAKEWGIRPDYPEGVFVSAMIRTQSGFSELALSLADALQTVVSDARAAAADELGRQRVLTQQTRVALENANGAIINMEAGARVVIGKLDQEKAQVTARLIEEIVPEMIRGVKEALVIKERRRDKNMELTRALGAAGLALALVISGYVWGTWSDWGLSSRIESVGAAIQRCQSSSRWADDKGHRLCEMSDFVQN
ncbi:hypothetical protein HN018_23445 (plasmid) [Lichenicola cladoniae]|uniref:Uncharacterized protein n=1 Tax=Lichenicola cladoniae TaxID=1484109 RepID=A0A6M8HYH8_9PROT|nr:hypothetical protein [Lichenicola cladoniae]NPD66325.1 hypothetical protein [Acetobacteraceae bacterium]QKE93141.1 hypothetical protein HN018_23445 [Lichenicola cladoniae]